MLNLKKNKGITLVALIVTIIILLILAGITISELTGTGIFEKAKQAVQEGQIANAREKIQIAVYESYDKNGKLVDKALKTNLEAVEGFQGLEGFEGDVATYNVAVTVDGYKFFISELGVVTFDGENTVVADKDTEEDKGLPENTAENQQPAGTEVALKDNWGTQTVNYTSTTDGTVKELETVATVYAVSVGNGDTVPVPKDFYYVGGDLNSGVIISDNKDDKYKYNPTTQKENDLDVDKTTFEYTTKLKGNQFVWIPCTTSEYKKCSSWNEKEQTNTILASTWWDTTTPEAELTQIEKYGGFYVARYEAGLASTITETTSNQIHTGSNQVYNLAGEPQSKAGIVPWNFIDWDKAKANAKSMYNNSYVSSGLITGTQWDVILNKMVSKGELNASDLTDSSSWGNCMNNKISYTGRLARADYGTTNSGKWTLKPFGTATTGETSSYSSNNGDLLTTGASSVAEKYHIFDMAGNLWEWTEEDSHAQTSGQYRVYRGGSLWYASSDFPACYRAGDGTTSWTSANLGFRAVLYIK